MKQRLLALSAGATVLALVTGCGSSSGTESMSSSSCDELLGSTIALIRSGQTGNGYDALSDTIETLRTSDCPQQYEVFADYASASGVAEQLGPEPCSELAKFAIEPAAIRLLRQDGLCKGAARVPKAKKPPTKKRRPAPARKTKPGGGISWNEAIHHVGTKQRVCGPLAGIGDSDDDVFLNLGRDYPDPKRFTIVLWDVGGVETVPAGTTLCVTGRITLYEGVAQIKLTSTNAVKIHQ